ncbi:triacylglycerol lipase [Aeromicrobium panaciterrae]|uniref:Triacylglycerol lipase n=1 Tax=Aeromicrobium panaciterrae TaxID=363861 RepID=A0ABU1UJI8_9ACTN|nr:lipase [Aeromicrobium panaciterrae]MDR7085354.1 triacylglycerol lipase [Aeromicrobium panaciterrae]
MRRLITLATVVIALLLAGSPATAATKPLPVPYNFLPAAMIGGTPNANAPGTNDWTCKPSKAHPRPVVLTHGTLGNHSTNWQTYGPLLKNNGYCVYALTYGALPAPYPLNALAGLGSMRVSAKELDVFVDRVLKSTKASKVDIIGHSQGTLMPTYYLKFYGGAKKVYNHISLAPLWHGTEIVPAQLTAILGTGAGSLPFAPALGEMDKNSSFMKEIRKGGVAVKGVRYLNIMTKYDELVRPYTSGSEKGMTNIVVQDKCAQDYSEHFEIAADRNASLYVLNFLDPAHPRPIVCTLSLPFVGP